MTSVEIPNSVTTIEHYTFYGCTGLTSIEIPKSVTTIDSYAFASCTNLDSVIMLPTFQPSCASAFYGNAATRTFYVPCGKYSEYSDYSPRQEFFSLFTIDVSSDNAEQGTASIVQQSGNNVACDSTAIVQAVANYGYHFDHWSDGDTTTPRTLVLERDTAVTAYFARNIYTLTLTSIDTTLGIVNTDSISGEYLDTIVVTATPIPHHHFVRWNDGATENPRQFVFDDNHNYTAYFAIDTHTVSVASSNILYGDVDGGGLVVYGEATTVTAAAYSGYEFVRWSNGVTNNPYTFAVTADVELTAIFAEQGTVHFITAIADDPTTGSVSGGGQYATGETVTLTAIPAEGYQFDHWNDGSTTNPRDVIVAGDATYTAYFVALNAIDDVEANNVRIYTNHTEIVVEGAEGLPVSLYDINGRKLDEDDKGFGTVRFYAPASGAYMVRIGERTVKKVVVVR